MIRTVMLAGAALVALSAFSLVSAPANAGGCALPSAKARGLNEDSVSDRSVKQLGRKVNHWAKKNGYTAVRVGPIHTACAKGTALTVCSSTRKVCP